MVKDTERSNLSEAPKQTSDIGWVILGSGRFEIRKKVRFFTVPKKDVFILSSHFANSVENYLGEIDV